jgi:predicted nicotinamide N-methyase
MYQTRKDQLKISGIEVSILSVTNVDALYENLVSKGEAHEDVKDERIPYWADLWPSAIALCEHLHKTNAITNRLSVHDMGCGLGLPGIFAGMLGANVIFSDYLEEALDFAAQNWKLNLSHPASFVKMDWRKPDPFLKADLLIASDVAYEKRSFDFLPETFRSLVKTGGKSIVSEPNRLYSQDFFESLKFSGFNVEKFNYHVEMKGVTHRINVFEISSS